MIDHIGTSQVSLRKTPDGVSIRLLNRTGTLDLTSVEWVELASLIVGVKAVVDFQDSYGSES